jgi:hypothetical protein
MSSRRNYFVWQSGFLLLNVLFMYYIVMQSGASVTVGAGAAMLWGLFTLALLVSGHVYRARRQQKAFQGKKQAQSSTESRQSRTVEIDLPRAEALTLALEALQALDNNVVPAAGDRQSAFNRAISKRQALHLKHVAPGTGRIDASLRVKLSGVTDVLDFTRLTVTVEAINATTTRVNLTAEATAIDTYDMGKNAHYVRYLATYLRRESQQKDAESRLSDNSTSHTSASDVPDAQRHQQTTD